MAKITAESLENYQVRVAAVGHEIVADEPPGTGDGRGPNPYELLLAALASCTVMTVRMYANRKEWPLEKVRAELTFDRVHAEDCAGCEAEHGIVERIGLRLAFEGDLTGEQRDRLRYIASRCPVRKTLGAGPEIVETAE